MWRRKYNNNSANKLQQVKVLGTVAVPAHLSRGRLRPGSFGPAPAAFALPRRPLPPLLPPLQRLPLQQPPLWLRLRAHRKRHPRLQRQTVCLAHTQLPPPAATWVMRDGVGRLDLLRPSAEMDSHC